MDGVGSAVGEALPASGVGTDWMEKGRWPRKLLPLFVWRYQGEGVGRMTARAKMATGHSFIYLVHLFGEREEER